jgi:hypothetical protein
LTGSASSGGRKKTGTKRKTSSLTSKAKSRRKSTTKKAPARKKATKATAGDDMPKSPRCNSDEVVANLPKSDLTELYRFWSGDMAVDVPRNEQVVRDQVLEWMGDQEYVAARIAELGKRLGMLLDMHLRAPRYQCMVQDVADSHDLAYLSTYDLEACFTTLGRRGLLVEGASNGLTTRGGRCHAVPTDIADTVLRQRRAERRGIFDTFTLRGFLDRLYDDPARAARTAPGRVRELYKMYSNEPSVISRVERLPDGLRDLVGKVVLEFGGLLPRALFDRMETELPHWNGRRWGKILSESLIGTVERLELARYGLNHNDETLIVFNEVALAWLRRVAVPGDPDAPHDEASLGVDLVSNISRFLGFIIDHNVRFTVRGEIFKTTEKRILQDLIPNPGRELERAEVLDFIYRFSRHESLIKSTGERAFTLTTEGRDWEPQELEAKLQGLLEYALEESDLGGEHYHQVRMRRIFLRMIKRVEQDVWYDIMYLPFLVRNNYLCSLDEGQHADEYFGARQRGGYTPMEDLQRMAWNLVGWVRKRLYLLGIVDLGYDKTGRPVAMRLTRIGASLLGVEQDATPNAIGNLVVTPDFEIVLFPTGDDAKLTHDLDRFCERESLGHLIHFRISEKSVHRALAEGMSVSRIIDTLEINARTPVPQNVVYSIRGWASQAGLLYLNKKLLVRCDDPDTLTKFVQDPGVRSYVRDVIDDSTVQLKSGTSASRMRSLLRDLDYLIELE